MNQFELYHGNQQKLSILRIALLFSERKGIGLAPAQLGQ